MQTSNRLIEAIRNAPLPAWRIGVLAGLHPSTISRIVNGQLRLRPDDSRVHAIARVLGVDPADALDDEGA